MNVINTINNPARSQQQNRNKHITFGMKPETGLDIVRGIFNHGIMPRAAELAEHSSAVRDDFCKRAVENYADPAHKCGKPNCLNEATNMLVTQLAQSYAEQMPHNVNLTNLRYAVETVSEHVTNLSDLIITMFTGEHPKRPQILIEQDILKSFEVIKDKPEP